MGVRTQEKVERNVELYNRWKNGASILELQNSYDLSGSGVWNIISRYRKKYENKTPAQSS